MNRLRKPAVIVAACMAMVFALAFTGCASTQNADSASSSVEAGATVITDAYNRSVELPSEVNTVATVGSGARFVVYAGAQNKLIAVTEMETEASPARPYTMVCSDLVAGLPATSNGNHLMETNVNTEQLLELAPDVIISSRSASECDKLQAAIGIPVVGISYQDQLFSDDVYTSIEVVGEACGTSEHADQVVKKMKEWETDLTERASKVSNAEKPSVYVGAVNYKGAKSFGGTYAHYAPLDILEAVNVADETGQTGSVEVELEQIGVWNPDYMFLNMGNMNLMKQDYANNQEFFDNLSAFKSGNLYSQPSFNYNGTNVEMGICDTYFIGVTIYPAQFGDIDPAKKYAEIFETMLGANYYETMKSNGMDFKQVKITL